MPSISIRIRGMHIPSFKNAKHKGKHGNVYTDSKVKERVQALENALLSALLSEFRITSGETPTACSLRSWIVSSVPEDDSWQCLAALEVMCGKVPKGDEGVTIEIIPIIDEKDSPTGE